MALQKLRDTCQLNIPVTRDLQTVKLDELDYHQKIAEAFYTSLSLLISFGRMYTATLPEDKVFAPAALLLPLFSSKIPAEFRLIDYSKPVRQTYTDANSAVICYTKQLWLLSGVEEIFFVNGRIFRRGCRTIMYTSSTH
jgi:hypothetical protein